MRIHSSLPVFRQLCLGLVLALFSLHFVQCFAGPTQADWPLYGREYNNQRFSPLKQINRRNNKLKERRLCLCN